MRLIDAEFLFEKLDENSWYDNADRDIAEDLVLSAPTIDPESLRPTREQVEKMWRGEWKTLGAAKYGKPGVHYCTKCEECHPYKHNFCPDCGSPMTDEAVDIVVERLEALKDETAAN